ncbi:glycosyltransferase family 4 protein [Natribaculum luteum]|uniref:Glycosyltransferase family 4 protein n=1 Tax=Natribaculum luteum TaxID=1586232 RepID=A0ABD5NX13_9EURY|nr:glycosyltransferase [Natribaculum luteum]
MDVLYILSQSESGLPHYTAQLANAVAKEANVTVLKPSETTADDVFSDDVRTINAFQPMELSLVELAQWNISPKAVADGFLSYRNLTKVPDLDPDVVHTPTNLFPQVQLAAKWYGIGDSYPFIVTYHEVFPNKLLPDRPLPGIVHNWINRGLPSPAEEKTIVHTDAAKANLVERGRPSDDVHVISHPSYDMFDNAEMKTREEKNTILYFGTIVPYKDIDLFTSAAVKAAQEINDLTAIIAGNGELPKASRKRIQNHPDLFEVRTEFVPNDEVGEYFERAQALILPYLSREGQMGHSGVRTIGHSFGVPIIATDVGEFKAQIADSGSGLIVPEGDSAALASAIQRLLENDDERESMAQQSQQQSNEISWTEFADRHLTIYEQAIDSSDNR